MLIYLLQETDASSPGYEGMFTNNKKTDWYFIWISVQYLFIYDTKYSQHLSANIYFYYVYKKFEKFMRVYNSTNKFQQINMKQFTG